jgi:hypothetical protein
VGAPSKTNRKLGTKVTQVTSSVASTAATHGSSSPGARYALSSATTCTTMISGPGVVSADARPRTISRGPNQP